MGNRGGEGRKVKGKGVKGKEKVQSGGPLLRTQKKKKEKRKEGMIALRDH